VLQCSIKGGDGFRGRPGGFRGGEERFGRGGAGAGDGREEHAIEEREEDLRHFFDGLVAQATEDERARGAGFGGAVQDGPEAGAQSPGAGGIMRNVEDPGDGFGAENFEAAWPVSITDSMLDRASGDGQAVMLAELDGGSDGQSDIALLMRAFERRGDFNLLAENLKAAGSFGIKLGRRSDRRNEGRGADAANVETDGDFAEGLVGIRVLREGHEHTVAAEDAGLFAGDGRDGGAQPLGVVERNVGDDRDQGIDDVGGIEATAHADFEHGDVHGRCREVEEAHRRERFKEAGVLCDLAGSDEAVGCFGHREVIAGEVAVGDFMAVDADALIGALEMGRGVEAGAEAGRLEDEG